MSTLPGTSDAQFFLRASTRLWPPRPLTRGQGASVQTPPEDIARTLAPQRSARNTGHAREADAPRPNSPHRSARPGETMWPVSDASLFVSPFYRPFFPHDTSKLVSNRGF